jgi:ATP-dependent exoDNAse (exonuclease V) beta subunit
LLTSVDAAQRQPARQLTEEILERLAEGPLLARLNRLAAHVVARELCVVAPPGDPAEGPVGGVAGVIDMVYRDPDDGAWVVCDFKTDRVEGAELSERAAHYAPQAAAYTSALQSALDLPAPPRCELWFLHAGEVAILGGQRPGPAGPALQ